MVVVGRVEAYKRVGVLLRAMRRVRAAGVDARASIVGTGDGLPKARSLARELGIGENVDFPGFVGEDEKIRLLQCAHVCVQPSEKEGWGLTVIEANACGTPVIAADAPGLRDSVCDGETGILVPVGDDGVLADALTKILSDAELRERLSRGAVEWAAHFRWDRAAAGIGEALDAACGRKSGEGESPPPAELSLSIRQSAKRR